MNFPPLVHPYACGSRVRRGRESEEGIFTIFQPETWETGSATVCVCIFVCVGGGDLVPDHIRSD